MENTNGRIVKRRIMEAQGGGGGGGAAGAEVRRIHILYFLSRNGRNEHPHLIRIHHLSKNGVRLKDIKRWLGELRGKDMPESFAWSFKRTYKNGYVWQDILDDDLLTPISDNEYVLKGSEISSTTTHNLDFSRMPKQKEQNSTQEPQDRQRASPKEIEDDIRLSHSSSYVSSKASSAQDSFGSETSTSTQDSVNDTAVKSPGDPFVQEEAVSLLSDKKKRKTNKLEIINGKGSVNKSKTADTKSSHRKSHSGIFRNFISCGGVETNDSVLTVNSKRYKPLSNSCTSSSAQEVRDSAKEKKGAAAYRPLYGPKCSQCGKRFKPEKLQSHMNSCKGMKALAKGCNAAKENKPKRSTASRNEDSVSAYLLTQNC